jgi:hypothetical protein
MRTQRMAPLLTVPGSMTALQEVNGRIAAS